MPTMLLVLGDESSLELDKCLKLHSNAHGIFTDAKDQGQTKDHGFHGGTRECRDGYHARPENELLGDWTLKIQQIKTHGAKNVSCAFAESGAAPEYALV